MTIVYVIVPSQLVVVKVVKPKSGDINDDTVKISLVLI